MLVLHASIRVRRHRHRAIINPQGSARGSYDPPPLTLRAGLHNLWGNVSRITERSLPASKLALECLCLFYFYFNFQIPLLNLCGIWTGPLCCPCSVRHNVISCGLYARTDCNSFFSRGVYSRFNVSHIIIPFWSSPNWLTPRFDVCRCRCARSNSFCNAHGELGLGGSLSPPISAEYVSIKPNYLINCMYLWLVMVLTWCVRPILYSYILPSLRRVMYILT